MPDCWLEVSTRKVLRPANSAQVFLGFPVPISKRWDGSQVATASFSCSPLNLNFVDPYFIFMYMHYNHCHRVTDHLQLNVLLFKCHKFLLYTPTRNFTDTHKKKDDLPCSDFHEAHRCSTELYAELFVPNCTKTGQWTCKAQTSIHVRRPEVRHCRSEHCQVLTLNWQHFVKNFCTESRENQTTRLVTDAWSETVGWEHAGCTQGTPLCFAKNA
jgi:hypothetical protein